MEGSSYDRRHAAARQLALLALVGLTAVGLGTGCGDSAEPSGPTVIQRVTRDFGHEMLRAENEAPLEDRETALRLLKRYEEVEAGFGGAVVESIDGLDTSWKRATKDGDETTWVLNVNGVEADVWPVKYGLYPGDVVQWDRRDWYITLETRATVGAFPQTFTRGVFGKRFPVTVECARSSPSSCAKVEKALRDAGVRIDGSPPAGGVPPLGQPQRARVLVGPWSSWHTRAWPQRVDEGPRYSGVFARFSPNADELRLLDWNAHRVRTAGAGTGLVAALQPTEGDLLWLVTGVDEEGVDRAANALSANQLRDAYAVAITDDGVEKLPLAAP